MKLAHIVDGRVHDEATAADAALVGPGDKPVFDIRDVSGVEGIAIGWLANADGTYTAPPQPVIDLAVYAKARRDATEASGITVNGVAIASDTDSQNRVNNAYNGMLVSGVAEIPFKSGSGFVTLTLDQVKAIGTALFTHTQACFSAEDQVDAALSANPPTITTTAEVDAVFAAVKSAF